MRELIWSIVGIILKEGLVCIVGVILKEGLARHEADVKRRFIHLLFKGLMLCHDQLVRNMFRQREEEKEKEKEKEEAGRSHLQTSDYNMTVQSTVLIRF